jgi:hypothetical protein
MTPLDAEFAGIGGLGGLCLEALMREKKVSTQTSFLRLSFGETIPA